MTKTAWLFYCIFFFCLRLDLRVLSSTVTSKNVQDIKTTNCQMGFRVSSGIIEQAVFGHKGDFWRLFVRDSKVVHLYVNECQLTIIHDCNFKHYCWWVLRVLMRTNYIFLALIGQRVKWTSNIKGVWCTKSSDLVRELSFYFKSDRWRLKVSCTL